MSDWFLGVLGRFAQIWIGLAFVVVLGFAIVIIASPVVWLFTGRDILEDL